MQIKCKTCNKEFFVHLYAYKSQKYKNCSLACRAIYRKVSGANAGSSHYAWKGDNVSYRTLHSGVRKAMLATKPERCPSCNEVKKDMDIANKGIYNRDLKNWEWLCHKCHLHKDGIIGNKDKQTGKFQRQGISRSRAYALSVV